MLARLYNCSSVRDSWRQTPPCMAPHHMPIRRALAQLEHQHRCVEWAVESLALILHISARSDWCDCQWSGGGVPVGYAVPIVCGRVFIMSISTESYVAFDAITHTLERSCMINCTNRRQPQLDGGRNRLRLSSSSAGAHALFRHISLTHYGASDFWGRGTEF